MDALLVQAVVNPFCDSSSIIKVAQLGLYYLAEYAAKFNYNVKVKYVNVAFPIVDELYSILKDNNCDTIGFYTDCENIWQIRRAIAELRRKDNNLKIVVGGPQITGAPEESIKLLQGVTCGIIGEGEEAFVEFLQLNDYSTTNLLSIKGVVLSDKDGVQYAAKRDINKNIDDYGYPRREKYSLDLNDLSFGQLVSGRGCVGRCAFCFEGSKTHNTPRVRSLDSCLEEFDYLVNTFNLRYVNIVDDTFILNRRRTVEFCNKLIERYQGKIKWYCEARADILSKNIDLLPLLKEAGLVRLQLGGESGNQDILNAYNKGITLEQVDFVVKEAIKVGIPFIFINYIVGGAFETEETFNQTLDLAKRLINYGKGNVEIDSSIFTPTPGSPIYNEPEKFGLKIIDREQLRSLNYSYVFCETETLSQEKVYQLRSRFKNEIAKEYMRISRTIPKERLLEIYDYTLNYKVDTYWYYYIHNNVGKDQYLSLCVKDGYSEFSNINACEISDAVPFRTKAISSNGQMFYRISENGEFVANDNALENEVLSYSAGKLSYAEIREIIIKHGFLTEENAYESLAHVYRKFEDEYAIIWKVKN